MEYIIFMTRAEYEKSFTRAGLPLFIEDRQASHDVWTRALPLMIIIFWLELFGAVDLQWSALANILTLSGGLIILSGAWALSNHLRGRRLFAAPQDVNRTELFGFLFIPAALPLIFNAQWFSSAVTLAGNATFLLLSYGIIAYGIIHIIKWALRRLFDQLVSSISLLARALPLLLLFAVVLLISTEMWQVFADMNSLSLLATSVLLVAVGSLFLLVRLPREVAAFERRVQADGPELSRPQRINVGLVMFVSQSLQVIIVTVALGSVSLYLAY